MNGLLGLSIVVGIIFVVLISFMALINSNLKKAYKELSNKYNELSAKIISNTVLIDTIFAEKQMDKILDNLVVIH